MARSKAFDPEDKLTLAMRLFWHQGYENCSMQMLVDEMGINRFSLYNTYGDKAALFHQALLKYQHTYASPLLEILQAPGADIRALVDYFDTLKHQLLGPQGGCLMQTASVSEQAQTIDPVRAITQEYNQKLQTLLSGCLSHAQKKGQLPKSLDTQDAARSLYCRLQGWLLLSRHLDSKQLVVLDIESAIRQLKGARP